MIILDRILYIYLFIIFI